LTEKDSGQLKSLVKEKGKGNLNQKKKRIKRGELFLLQNSNHLEVGRERAPSFCPRKIIKNKTPSYMSLRGGAAGKRLRNSNPNIGTVVTVGKLAKPHRQSRANQTQKKEIPGKGGN